MIIYSERIPENSAIIEQRFKERKVNIFSPIRKVWVNNGELVTLRKNATAYSFLDALNLAKEYRHPVEFHFIDIFGDENFTSGNIEDEDIYNKPFITFDKHRRLGS